MKATVLTPAVFIRSTTAATISGNGCDTVTVQRAVVGRHADRRRRDQRRVESRAPPRRSPSRPARPRCRSARRPCRRPPACAHCAPAVVGSEASSSTISSHLAAGDLRMLARCAARMPFSYGMPRRRDRARQRADEADLQVGRRGRRGDRERERRSGGKTGNERASGVLRSGRCGSTVVQGTSFHWPFSSLTITRERSSEP